MAYLMHIGFDNSSRFQKNIYYFEYKGIRYKLIQNNVRKWCDVLLTIIYGINNKKDQDKAFINAAEFLSALAWENNAKVKLRHLGGPGGRNFTLKKARCTTFSFPEVPFSGYLVGADICTIPKIETEEQRNSLILFREASSSNNDYLAFMFFWQILESGRNDPIGWINKAYRKNRYKIRVTDDDIKKLPLNGGKIGNYFYDDCRNAIAHIFRLKKGRKIKLDTPDDDIRITISARVIKEFARFYIKDHLKLEKHMYLVRKKGKGFPVYKDEEEIRRGRYSIAYKRPYFY